MSKGKSISIAARKSKGREFQKFVCQKISELTGYPWGHDQPIESRGMGQNGVDIRLEKKALSKFRFSVECKRQETWAIPQWIKQAKENQIKGTDWLLFIRSSHAEPIVVMDANAFFEMLGKHANTQNTQLHGDGKKPKKMLRTKPPNG
jgi:hypothetical protein